jgi:NAD dependent epimerase/dehydratase family enzyme
VNATAPHPVTNREFARALGRAMRRPSVLPVPGFALKLAVGEFAESLLTGQRVIPARAEKEGYHFRYPDLQQAFRGIFGE